MVNFFILSTFDKHEAQLLAKLKKILYKGFRVTLNFPKFNVALNPMHRFFLPLFSSIISSVLVPGVWFRPLGP